MKPVASVMPSRPMPTPIDRGQQRQAGGEQRAEGDREHERRDGEAEDLADRRRPRRLCATASPPNSTCTPAPCPVGRLLDRLDGRRRGAPPPAFAHVTCASAMRPSLETSLAAKGSLTAMHAGRLADLGDRGRRPLRVAPGRRFALGSRRRRSGRTRRWPAAAAPAAGRSPSGTRCPGSRTCRRSGRCSVGGADAHADEQRRARRRGRAAAGGRPCGRVGRGGMPWRGPWSRSGGVSPLTVGATPATTPRSVDRPKEAARIPPFGGGAAARLR